MLPKKNRMVRAEDFSHVLRRGVRGGNKYLVVSVAFDNGRDARKGQANDPQEGAVQAGKKGPAAEAEHQKVGFVIPKRQIPLAVDRNRVRRRLRHLIARRLPDFPPGSLIAIRVMAPSATLNGQQLERKLDAAIVSVLKKLPGSSL